MKSTPEFTLANIDARLEEIKRELDHAKMLISKSNVTRAVMIHDAYFTCSFAGKLLVTVTKTLTGGTIYLQDADDYNMYRDFASVEHAERVFDELFSEFTLFDKEFVEKLHQYGIY
jgi:hypothetical protein